MAPRVSEKIRAMIDGYAVELKADRLTLPTEYGGPEFAA